MVTGGGQRWLTPLVALIIFFSATVEQITVDFFFCLFECPVRSNDVAWDVLSFALL